MNHIITQHMGGNASADAHGGEDPCDLNPIYPAMLQVMELMGKQRINPADGNYVPSGFKEYDKTHQRVRPKNPHDHLWMDIG